MLENQQKQLLSDLATYILSVHKMAETCSLVLTNVFVNKSVHAMSHTRFNTILRYSESLWHSVHLKSLIPLEYILHFPNYDTENDFIIFSQLATRAYAVNVEIMKRRKSGTYKRTAGDLLSDARLKIWRGGSFWKLAVLWYTA